MRYSSLFLIVLFVMSASAQEYPEFSRLTWYTKPYVGPDGMVLRSNEDSISANDWTEAKRKAYAQYPLAIEMSEDSIPKTASEMYEFHKGQSKPIAIGHRWAKLSPKHGAIPPFPCRLVFWLEPRPKYLNDDELRAAAERGDFDALFPTFPIGKFSPVKGKRLGSRYSPFPIPVVATRLSVNGVPPDGPSGEVCPIDSHVDLYSAWSFPSKELIADELDNQLVNLGSGRLIPKWDEILDTPQGVVLKGLGTQFGHKGYRWVSGGNLFILNILGDAPGVLDAFLKQNPSDLPKDFSLDLKAAGMVILRRGLARLKAAPPVLEDDGHMIRIRPFENRDQFQRGINLLHALKDLWPVVYGYDQARRKRYDQHLSPNSTVFSWQSYIDEETAARAEVIAAVTAFAEQAEKRGLIRQEKVSRRPWAEWAEDALPPCYVLGPEK